MIDNKNVVCIIPARGGSKGVPRKNIKLIANRPLIAYTIRHALQSRYIDRTIVSTEDREIACISRQYGAEIPFMRPDYLSTDSTPTIDVLRHIMECLEKNENYSCDIVVLLHATSPLRDVSDIDACIRLLIDKNANNVISVTETHANPYFNMVEKRTSGIHLVKRGNFSARQAAPEIYVINGSVYVWRKDTLRKTRKVVTKQSELYVMPRERSIDIDDLFDFRIAEILLTKTH